MSDEVVAQGVQAAGDVGQAHRYLYEQADAGLGAAVLNHPLVHLEWGTEKLQSAITSARTTALEIIQQGELCLFLHVLIRLFVPSLTYFFVPGCQDLL